MNTHAIDGGDGEDLLNPQETSAILHVTKDTLARWRCDETRAQGPRFVKIGRKVFYRRVALRKWIQEQEIVPGADREVA